MSEYVSIIGKTGAIYFIVFFFSLYRFIVAYRRESNEIDLFDVDIEYYWGIILSSSFSLLLTFLFMQEFDPFWRIHVGYILVLFTSGIIVGSAIIRKRIRNPMKYNLASFVCGIFIVSVLYVLDSIFSVYQVFECDRRCLYWSYVFGYTYSINIVTFMSYGWFSAVVIIWTTVITTKNYDLRDR